MNWNSCAVSIQQTNHWLSLASVAVIISAMESEQCKDDIAYAMTPFKLITWPIDV